MLSIDKNQMMLEHFEHIRYVSKERICIALKDVVITIQGDAMQVIALGKDEILIEGTFKVMEFVYEK
ncbi:YabP/YqfC family sporulation protein [Amedibacillus sp. YH-ame6]